MLFELNSVNKTYKSGEVITRALNDVTLEIDKGEFIVVLGPSGSGKTTLLNVMGGLDTPDSGSIIFEEGLNITGLAEDKLTEFRRNHLGFVFQQYNLLQNLTALDNVRMGADIGKKDNKTDPLSILEKVGLGEFKDKYPYQLSGGEQQRVSIARSIAKNPDVLFCDEPTGSLDEEKAKNVLGVIENLNIETELTVVLITHNEAIAKMADRIIRMNSGKIEESVLNKEKIAAKDLHWGK